MIRGIDHFGGDRTGRAIKGGKGLIQLGHVAANGRVLFNEMDLEPLVRNVKGRLHPGNARANHENLGDHLLWFCIYPVPFFQT
jgi:hypothetical protein